MSNGKLFGIFTGAQITAMVCAALIAPGAVYAASYTYVVLTDPVTGHGALVDPSRRLSVYDPSAGYTNDPQYIIDQSYFYYGNQTVKVYTVPAGKTYIIKSINMTYNSGTANYDNSARFNVVPASGSGAYFITGFDDPNIVGTHYSDLGPGYVLHAGDSLQLITTVPVNFSLIGTLLPSTAR